MKSLGDNPAKESALYDATVDECSEVAPCEAEGCQECCPHDQIEYNQCADCEKEFDPGAAIDRAMDALEDR